jgi:8-oxo-dGTP diphosphatase
MSDRNASNSLGFQVMIHIVIFSLRTNQLKLLLVPFDSAGHLWSLPGNPIQPGQSLEGTALQEIARLTGRHDAYLEQLYTYGEPERNPAGREIAVVYFALFPASSYSAPSDATPSAVATSDIKDVEKTTWFPVDSHPDMAFDNDSIITYALRRLRYKLEYSAVGFELLPETFTLSELQHTYEIILGEKLDKRNFRRRILESTIIEPTVHLRMGEGRPARLYRYRPDAVAEVKARRLFP